MSQSSIDSFDKDFRRGSASSDPDAFGVCYQFFLDELRSVNQISRGAIFFCHFTQTVGIRARRAANDEDDVGHLGQLLDGILPVLRGVADVVFLGADDRREAGFQGGDDFFCIVDREGRLRHVGEAVGIVDLQFRYVVSGFDEIHTIWALAHRAFDFGVSLVADHDDFAAVFAHAGDFEMNFGDQWAGGVEDFEVAHLGFVTHGLGNAVGAENDGAARRNFRQLLDEDGAFRTQIVADEFVVHDFVTNVNGGAEFLDCTFDDGDGALDAGAETAGICEGDMHGELCGNSDGFDYKETAYFVSGFLAN